MWTQFHDMHSGGGLKESPYHQIFIEAARTEAEVIFYNRFGHNPNRISCTCCGEDYSIREAKTLEKATAFERGLRYAQAPKLPDGRYDNTNSYYLEPGEAIPNGFKLSNFTLTSGEGITMPQYLEKGSVFAFSKDKIPLVIYSSDISDDERVGEIPLEG